MLWIAFLKRIVLDKVNKNSFIWNCLEYVHLELHSISLTCERFERDIQVILRGGGMVTIPASSTSHPGSRSMGKTRDPGNVVSWGFLVKFSLRQNYYYCFVGWFVHVEKLNSTLNFHILKRVRSLWRLRKFVPSWQSLVSDNEMYVAAAEQFPTGNQTLTIARTQNQYWDALAWRKSTLEDALVNGRLLTPSKASSSFSFPLPFPLNLAPTSTVSRDMSARLIVLVSAW